MATVQQRSTATISTNGDGAIQVENPATGEVIGTVPDRSADEVAEIVARARAAQPAWEALGFAGRARILRRAQKWVVDNSERLIETIVSETGKTYEDAQLAEISYVANSFGFWAKHAPEFLADEKIKSSNPFVAGRKLDPALPPRSAWSASSGPGTTRSRTRSATASPRWPRATRRPQALRGHAAELAADGRGRRARAGCPSTSSRSPPATARPARPWSTRSTS